MASCFANNINKNCQKIKELSKNINGVQLLTNGSPNEFLNATGRYSVPSEVDNFNIDGDFTIASQTIEYIGDDRNAVGVAFINGTTVPVNANLSGIGSGTVTLSSPAANQIEIAASVTDPDFITLGYIDGDTIIIRYDDMTDEELIIASVTSQILTFTTSLSGTVGGTDPSENSAIVLKPTENITSSEISDIISKTLQNVRFKGYYATNALDIDELYLHTIFIQNFAARSTTLWELSGVANFEVSQTSIFGNHSVALLSYQSTGQNKVSDSYFFGSGSNTRALITISQLICTSCKVFSTVQGMLANANSTFTATSTFFRDIAFGFVANNTSRGTVTSAIILDLRGGASGGIISAGVACFRGGFVAVFSSTITKSPTAGTTYSYNVTRGGIIHVFPLATSGNTLTTLPSDQLNGSDLGAAATLGDLTTLLGTMFGTPGGGYITEG
jgi:hypothetical protein